MVFERHRAYMHPDTAFNGSDIVCHLHERKILNMTEIPKEIMDKAATHVSTVMSDSCTLWQEMIDSFIAGYSLRDAEVQELEIKIDELKDIDADQSRQIQQKEQELQDVRELLKISKEVWEEEVKDRKQKEQGLEKRIERQLTAKFKDTLKEKENRIKQLEYDRELCQDGTQVINSISNKRLKRIKELEELLDFANVPKILMEHPELLKGKPTEKDIEWAKGVLNKSIK